MKKEYSKNHYIAVQVKEGDKMAAYVVKADENLNLVSVLAGVRGLVSANIWPKADAERIVKEWNDGFKHQGSYLYA